jgi:dihydrofolate reductase
VKLVQSLMPHNLIDEYSLLVYPVVLGHGKRLFPEGIPQASLKLIEARSLTDTVVLMRYQPA